MQINLNMVITWFPVNCRCPGHPPGETKQARRKENERMPGGKGATGQADWEKTSLCQSQNSAVPLAPPVGLLNRGWLKGRDWKISLTGVKSSEFKRQKDHAGR